MNHAEENVRVRMHQMRYTALPVCCAVVVLALTAGVATGQPWYVKEAGSDGADGTNWVTAFATISNAVAQASADDDILVSNGTYVVSTAILVNKAVTISGYPPNTNTIVAGAGSNRLFVIIHDSAVVEYLSVTNGKATTQVGGAWLTGGGGAINMTGGTLRNCLVEKNSFTVWGVGGAMHLSGNSTVSNCVIRNNTLLAGSFGGAIGIYNNGANCLIVDCVIANNNGSSGGGIYMSAGTIERCTIKNNVGSPGGGVRIAGGMVKECAVYGNSSGSGSGSGVYISGGVVTNCVIRNQSFGRTGCGVYMTGGELISCTITNNKPAAWRCQKGAGIWMNGGVIRNTLIADNALGNYGQWGAGVHMEGGLLLSCTIADNHCSGPNPFPDTGKAGITGGGIHYEGGAITNCIIYGNTTDLAGDDDNIDGAGVSNACWYSCSPGLTNAANFNITDDPMFVGGGDYHLQSKAGHWTSGGWVNDPNHSPCIDMGPPLWTCVEPKPNGSRVNIGAYANTSQASRSLSLGMVIVVR